jgi:O-antigen ligase
VLSLDDALTPRSPPADAAPNLPVFLSGAWTMVGVIVYLLAPRVAPLVLLLSAVAPTLWHWAATGRLSWHRPTAITLLLGAAGVYLLVNGTWSLDRSSAYSEIGCFLLFAAAITATIDGLRATPSPALRAMAIGFLAGVLLAGAFLCFEAFSQQAVHRLLIPHVHALLPAPRHMRMEAGVVVFLEPYLLNRSTTALALLLWPAALVRDRLELSASMRAISLLGLALVVATIFRSEHATAKIAVLGAGAMFAVARLSQGFARRMAIGGWVAITLLVAPLATLAYSHQLYLASWLPGSARQRIVIWGYTSEQIGKAPLFGAGVSTARALNATGDEDAPRAPGSKYHLTTGWHSHNGYLQTWYETGAVGALFLLGLGLLVLRSLAEAAAATQPYLYATFLSCALMGGSSFSLWAPWFMASFGLTAVFAVLGAELERPVCASAVEGAAAAL